MQNLIALLKRYSTFLYFIILQVLCFILLISNNNFHKTKYWNSSNSAIGWIQETQTNVTEYLYLQQENDRLLDENSRLKEIVFGHQDVTKSDWLKMIDKARQVKYDYLPARVVANATQFKKNYLTLDVGTVDGVNPQELLGVVGPEGVVGFTKRGGSRHHDGDCFFLIADTSEGESIVVLRHIGRVIFAVSYFYDWDSLTEAFNRYCAIGCNKIGGAFIV